MFAQWRASWADALSPSFWRDVLCSAFQNVKKLFVVVVALLLISIGGAALAVPAMMQYIMALINQVRVVGVVGHFLLAATIESALLVFVLQACAPKNTKDGFGYFLSKVLFFWLITSLLFSVVGVYVPVLLVDVLRIVTEFALFAWVYDRLGFVQSFAFGGRMLVGSLPVVLLLLGLGMLLLGTQTMVLAASSKLVAWWGASFVIVTLYSLMRPALFIAMYHRHKRLYM